jgi:hypothetical protein
VLRDRERRAWEAAGEALVRMGDQKALAHFAELLEQKRDERDRQRIRGWMAQLGAVNVPLEPAAAGARTGAEAGSSVPTP